MNKLIKFILLSLGLLLFIVLIYQVGFSEIIKSISKAKPSFLFWGVFVYLIVIFLRSLRWFVLVRMVDREMRYKRLFPFYLVNSLIGNLTPFKSGETATPFLLKKYLKIPVGKGFSVVILDRFLELVVFVIILILAVLYILKSNIENGLVLSVFKWVFIVLFFFLTFLVIVALSKQTTLRIIRLFNFSRKYSLSKRLLDFVKKELDIFYQAMPLFKNKKIYQKVIPLVLLGWIFDFLAFYLIFSSILPGVFLDVAVAQVINLGASLITFIPGGLGISEISSVYILDLFGYPLILTTAGIILVRFFLTGTLVATGLIGSLLISSKD